MLRKPSESGLANRGAFPAGQSRSGFVGESSSGGASPADNPSGLGPIDQIYNQWIESGKPHNIVCSKCHGPKNLVHCTTCARSYHTSCLPSTGSWMQSAFYCPACRAGRWNGSQVSGSLASPQHRQLGTPVVRSPEQSIPASLPRDRGRASGQPEPHSTTPSGTSHYYVSAPDPFDPGLVTRAQDFLRTHGGFPESEDFSPHLLLSLGSIMSELQSHREQVKELMSENAHLRQDNANIRAYLDSSLELGRPWTRPVNNIESIPRPSNDTAGKSWDRIVMDLI
ncbi:hypothetical protein BDV18DRAFT_96189 [Aspergillus unguis]